MPNNDSHQHVVKTTEQWNDRAIENWVVPRGCLCVELTPEHKTKIKIGEGNKFYHQLPYISESDLSNYYTKTEVDNIINNLHCMAIKSVDEYDSVNDLPTTGNKLGDVRFVKSTNTEIKPDPDTYVWNGSKWLMVSTPIQDIDPTDYVTKEEFNPIKNKLDEIYPKAHTHANKDILDGITQADRDKFDDLHNYDDTEIRELIAETTHTHPNKSILDSITYQSILSTADREKFESLHNYDDSSIKTRVTFLESQTHTHSNKSVLDRITQETLDNMDALATSYVIIKNDIADLKSKEHTHDNKGVLDSTTAAYTIEQRNELIRLSNIGPFIGAGPTWDGYLGYVPAPEMGQQTYFLRADGTWAKTKSGDKYKAGEGITILSGEVISDTFPFEIFPKASTVTQYIIYGNASGVGNLVSGRYEVPIKISAPGYSDRVQTITVNDPLYDGDYIDYNKQVFAHYRTNISSQVTVDTNYGSRKAIYSNGTIDRFDPGAYGGKPYVSNVFELTPGATYELHPWDTLGSRLNDFHDGMYLNLYDTDMNISRTLYQEHLGNTVIVVASNEKYMRMTMQGNSLDVGSDHYQALYMLYPVESPCQLQQLTLYPGVINTIDVLTTNKPNEIYVEVVQPEEPDPSDPSSDYTGIIYNDGVLDVTQEDPDNLNELTIHFRDDEDKTITIPPTPIEPATTTTLGGVIVGDNLTIDEDGVLSAVGGSGGGNYIAGDGIEITADPTHIIFDREHVIDLRYYFDSQVDCKLPGFSTTPARTYTKLTNEKTLGALVSRYCTGFATPLTGPFFVSTVQSAVEFGQDYDATTFPAAANTFEYLGLTWYYTDIGSPNFGYGMSYVGGDTPSDMLDHMLRLDTVYPENTSLVDIAKDIIDAANLVSTINTVSAKLGNGLQFDANGAIEVTNTPIQYVRVSTTDSFVLLHTKPADWDDHWDRYFELSYDEILIEPADWDPTRHYKYENDNYVLGTAGDTFVSTTWYDKHYNGLDPNTAVVFDSDVYYTGDLQLIEDGETYDTAFAKVNEAIEHIERLEGEVEYLKDEKISVRTTVDPERIEFYKK